MQLLVHLTIVNALISISKSETIFIRKEKFLSDFLNENTIRNYNFYGCLSRRQQHTFWKKQFNNEIMLERISFMKSAITAKERNVHWLIADAKNSCDIIPYLKEVNDSDMFRLPFKHLILIPEHEYENHMGYLKELEILPMSEVIIAEIKLNEIILTVIYKVGTNSQLIKENYGIWTLKDGLKTYLKNTPYSNRRKNFHKYPIKFGTVLFEDKDIINSDFDNIPPTSDSFFQQDMPILYALLQSLNATMKIYNVYDSHGFRRYNSLTGQSTVDGMAKDLFERKIDLGSTTYFILERFDLIQPLSPIDYWAVKFFLKKPSLSYVKNIYILTLSNSVWIATLIVTVMFAGAIYVTLKWEITTYRKKNIHRATIRNVRVSDMFLLSFEALCQQGTSIKPLKTSGKLLLLFFSLMFMFIYVAYSASILVLLKSTANMDSLSDLLESRYEVGGLNQTYVKYFFQSPKTGILQKLYATKICRQCYYDESRGLEKVQKGNFAFFSPMVSAYKYFLKNFTNFDICSLQELPGYMNMKSYPVVPKCSGYTEIFKIWLLNLQERGIAERSKARVVRKPQCIQQAGNFQPVRILDCLYVIMIYIYGAMLSIFIIILEILIKKYSTAAYQRQITFDD